MFARILAMFTCTIADHTFPIALVHAYDTPIPRIPKKDKDLGLFRVRASPRAKAEFVSIRTFIRGAVLVPDFSKEGDYFVFDLLDSDMFLRVRQLTEV